MKSKKSSRTTDRHGQEDLPRTSAFSYLRSRLFHSGSTSPSHGHADNSSSALHDSRSMDTTPSAISCNPSRSSESTKRPVSVLQVDTLRRRESIAVTKEGLLYKKADFKAFHKASKRDRSWKLYRVVLRGHKLYLYKVSQDSQLQSFSVSPSVSSSVASVQRRIQNPEEIFNDPSLATDYVYGATFTEGDQTVCLLIFKNDLVIGVTTQGQWRIDCRVRLHQLQMDHDDTFIIKLTRERQQRTFESSSSEITAEWIDSFKEAQKASIDRRTKLYDGAHGHPDLEVRDGKVQAGSIEALVHELLYQTADKRSEEYLRAFLLTYSMFTTSAQVLEIFKRYVKVIDVHTRLIQIFTVWCEQFSQDVVGDVATKMLEILDELAATDSTAPDARATKEFVIHTVKRNGEICELAKSNNVATWENCNVVQDIKSASDPDQKIDLSNILASGMMPSLFLRLDPCHFAEQIYLFHLAMHRKHSKDLMSLLSYVPKPQLSTQMLNSLVFTTAAPHFISRMIRHHILVHSQQQDIANASSVKGILSRTRLIEHWIQVGKHLLQLGDMTGWCAVANGLCSLGVIRLKESWKAVKRDLVAQVAQEWVKLLSGYGFFPQDVWMDGWEKQLISDRFARVMFRDEQGGSNSNSNSNSNRSLPFFGTIRQTVDRLRKHVPQTCDGDIIYFQKFYGIYHAVNGGLEKCRERYSQLDLTNMPYPVVGPLQAFFERSVTEIISMPHDFKYLQECSLLCEPRVLGQSFDRHRRSGTLHDTNVAPPSTSVLKFPDVLEGYHLFQDNVRHDLSKKSSLRSVDDHNAPNAKTTQTRSPRVTSRKMFRRRTYSFPPGGAAATSVQDIHDFNILYPEGYLDTVHSKTWLASLASHRQGTVTAKALLDAAHRKDKTWYLVVQDGSLVFKASTLLQSDDSVTAKSVRPSVSRGFLALANKGSSGIRSRSGTLSRTSDTLRVPEDDENNKTAPILVNVKAGTLERLVDVLVDGVLAYNQDMRDQWHLLLSSEGLAAQKQYLAIDEEEFVSAFFVTYRSFCSCPQLLDLLRGKFTGAFESAKTHQRATALGSVFGSPDNVDEQVDWKKVAATQLKIINIMIYWVEEHVYDFVDEIQILEHVARFLQDAQFSLEEWQKTLQEQLRKHQQHQQQRLLDGDSKTAQQIGTAALRRLQELRILFIQKLLSPCYDLKAIKYETECSRKVDEFYRLLLAEQQQPFKAVILKAGSGDSLAFSLAPSLPQGAARLSQYSASTLLRQADKCARQLFASVTLQDWIQTFDVFEAQSMDLYAWLPSRKASHIPSLSSALSSVRDAPSAQQTSYHVPPEDVVISDIFTAIEGARQSMVSPTAFSADDLILALPGAIQYLYCMHFIIRSWAIHEITAPGLTTDARAQHIEKFLQIVVVSKAATEKMVLFPELRDVEDRPRRVPGFVEYAVASALISPEVRLFAKAWMKVAQRHCQAPLDTLENLLDQVEPSEDAHDMALVPSVGWIFDRMLELCTSVPDTYNHRQDMINFDKRRYVFHFLQLIMNAQMDLEEGDGNMCQEEEEDRLTFVICPQVNALSWKDLKELAHRENKSLATRGGAARGQRSTLVFNRMVGEQLDRLKRAIKERNRIDKECREQQHKLQKRQLEQAKLLEKQEKKTHQRSHSHSQLPKLNFILRSLRPHSILAMDPTFTAAKASTVINLIHSTTSVASAYTKRENVFRIVTEEGGQYLFQGMNRDDMHEWMQQINNAAREGTAKRQSVLASEEASKGNERRSHYAEEQENTHATLQTGNRKSVYGMELSILMSDGTIPPIVEKCIQEVEKRGLEEVGIYRMAGSGSVVEELKKAFNTNMDAVDLSDPRWADINVVADALKQFLRSIPGSLLTHECYDDFIHASASEDHDQRVYLIKQTLKKLPLPNYILLKRLVGHFVIVTDFEAINHMYATNLAIVFGPTLLQPAPGPASFATTMSNLGHHQTIVKYLILHYHFLFDIEAEEDEPVVESSNVSSVEDSGLAPEQL